MIEPEPSDRAAETALLIKSDSPVSAWIAAPRAVRATERARDQDRIATATRAWPRSTCAMATTRKQVARLLQGLEARRCASHIDGSGALRRGDET